jgi:small-conductance mechanosensitive channel
MRLGRIVWPLILAVISMSPAARGQVNVPTTVPAVQTGVAPVVFAGRELFVVKERVLSFSPEDRAKAISERIKKLAKDPMIRIESISVMDAETSTDIIAGDFVVMTVTNSDAKADGMPRLDLARKYADNIEQAITEYRESYNVKTLSLGIVFSLLATAALIIILKLSGKVFARIYSKISQLKGSRIKSLKIQSLEILPAERIAEALIGVVKMIRLIAVLVLLYIYLLLVFSFFPWTRGYAAIILGYILSPLNAVLIAFANFLPNIFFIGVIVFIARYIIKLLRIIFFQVGRGSVTFPGFYPEWAEPTYKIIRFLAIAFTGIIIFPYLPGSDSPAFQGISIFLGVLFSLGSTSAVANIIAGVILTYMRGFKIGDRVKIADTVGDVKEKTLLVTRVRTIKNVDVTIPNAMILGSHIVNFSSSAQKSGLILHTTVTISYDIPWKKVHELLVAAAKSTENILEDPVPFVLQTGLNDFFVSYELNAYTDQPWVMAKIYSDLHQNIQDKFNEAGIEIMSPHYSALRDGNRRAVPNDYLPKSYESPAFRWFQAGPPRRPSAEEGPPDPVKGSG